MPTLRLFFARAGRLTLASSRVTVTPGQGTSAVTLPRVPGQFHVGEWLQACKGGPKTFQGFETAAMVAEIAMVGMLAMRFKPGVNTFSTIEWDSEALKVKGSPEADAVVSLPMRQKWL